MTIYRQVRKTLRSWAGELNLLGEADKRIKALQERAPAPPSPPRPVVSMACQTSIKVEPEDAVGPNVKIPEPTTASTVTITTREHFVFKGAVKNVQHLINAQAQTKQELLEAKAGGSQEVVQALAKMTAERDTMRQDIIRERENHQKELAHATLAGRLLADYHAESYGQVTAEMVGLEGMGVEAEEYPPVKTYEEFVAIANTKDPSV